MATLICLGDNLILIEEEKILRIIELKDEDVIKNIDTVISKGNNNPIMIFQEAVEMLVPDFSFGNIRRKKKLGNQQISIHDQKYYRKFLEYILNHDSIVSFENRRKQRRQEKSEYIMKNREINGYKKENHYRVLKCLRDHYPNKL